MSSAYQIQTDPKKAEIRPEMTIDEHLSDINRKFGEEKVESSAAKQKLPYVDIYLTALNADLIQRLDLSECETAQALPFFLVGKKMRVAVADPKRKETKTYLSKLKEERYQVQISLASATGIQAKVTQLRALLPKRSETFENQDAEVALESYEKEIHKLETLKEDVYKISAASALNRIFIGALRTGASDIHLQPEREHVSLRLRIDGVMQEILTFDSKVGAELTDQLKYLAKLKLNLKNIPQDGRLSFAASGRTVDLRVSTLPTDHGESVVCRLLDGARKLFTFEELGYRDNNLKRIYHALNQRNGLILATGPTGSGKTTTLYTMLARLNKPERKIITLEDPVEYRIPGITQSQIREAEDYDFGNGLRSILRQDPDIIMVGEIRDLTTAETASQAAMTGHLVLSTVHTNSAIEAITRLINLGLKPYILAASLSLVLAQRLVRRIHTDCAQEAPITAAQRQIIEQQLLEIQKIDPNLKIKVPSKLIKPVGCAACSHTGYRGQIAVAESYTVDDQLRELILRGASAPELARSVREQQHMLTFAADGVLKVLDGITTLAEIARIVDLHPPTATK